MKYSATTFKAGDVVKITGSTYYNGKSVPEWVKAKNWIVHSASGDRVVINNSEDGVNAIMSPFKASDLALKNALQTPNEEPTKPGCYASTVIAVAQNELGYYEKSSNSNLDDKTANKGNANYTKYARDFDQKYPSWYNGNKNGYAWCDMFVDWCFLTAFGYEKALYLLCQPEKSAGAGCTYSLHYYKEKGQFYTSNPKAGDQIFFGTSVDNSSHTGLVENVEGGKVYTIEGNTSDMVARRTYTIGASNIVGYGRPNYDGAGSVVTTEPSTGSSTHSILRKGSTGDEVKELQQKLTTLGYSLGSIDGDFGDKTLAAVKKFQSDYSLEVDGVVGNQTWNALDKAIAAKASASYVVRVTTDTLNIRKGAGTNYAVVGCIRDRGAYTIVEEKAGTGASKWGLLKAYASGKNGWISLDYVKKV